MKKPANSASHAEWAVYREWVREQLASWDPADDRGSPTVYVPRYNGIFAEGVENVRSEPDPDDTDD